MYMIDAFKNHPDYQKILYTEALSAGSCCTIARALLANIRAYMRDDEINPSLMHTMRNMDQMFAMRDDWLNRLRDMELAEKAPLPFDETIGSSVPITTRQRAIDAQTAIHAGVAETQDTSGNGVDLIFQRAFASINEGETPPLTEKPKRARRTKKAAIA